MVLGDFVKTLVASIGFASLLASAGCYPVGALYTGTNVPDSAIDRVEVGGPGKTDDKVGEACATGILGLFAWGDAALDAAKRAGNITDVHVVDHKQTVVLFGAYYQACTVVHGK